MSGGESVVNLMIVQFIFSQLIFVGFYVVNIDFFVVVIKYVDKVELDFVLIRGVKRQVVEGELDMGFEGFVKGVDVVGCQNGDFVVVFQCLEKDCVVLGLWDIILSCQMYLI